MLRLLDGGEKGAAFKYLLDFPVPLRSSSVTSGARFR